MGGKQSFPIVKLDREKIVIVTGGNTGIGYETAKWIAMMGATVIIACRSEERAKAAIEKMNEDFKKEKEKRKDLIEDETLAVEFMKVDMASLKSVMAFINEFKESGRKLHSLVCNAGIGWVPQSYTEDGNEKIFQTNYLSHFLIIAHVLPIMMKSGEDCRIVSVSSSGHTYSCDFDLENIQGKKYTPETFDRFLYYRRSKLYQVMHMFSLNRRIKNSNVTVNSLHPGFVQSEFTRAFEDQGRYMFLWKFGKSFGISKDTFQGAETTINCVVNPELAGVRDVYFDDCKPKTPSSVARNEKYQEELWEYSKEILKDYLPEEIIDCMEGKTLNE